MECGTVCDGTVDAAGTTRDAVSRTWAEGTPSHPFPTKICRLDLTLHSPLIKVNTVYNLLRANEIQAGVVFSLSLAEPAPK